MGEEWYTTGLRQLDTILGMGYPGGSVVTLVAPAYTSGQCVVEEFATATDHPTHYVTTTDPSLVPPRIRDEADGRTLGVSRYSALEDGLGSAVRGPEVEEGDDVSRRSVVVDPVNPLLGNGVDLSAELGSLRTTVERHDSVCLIHLQAEPTDLSNDERTVLNASDGVIYYDASAESADHDHLQITKFRGLTAKDRRHRLQHTGGSVAISTDREL